VLETTSVRDIYKLTPGSTRLASLPSYQAGSVYGIDLSSGIAVDVLGVGKGMRVLDLCCAPGAKLCMMADRMEMQGELVGVDVAVHRVNTCRNIVRKYGLQGFAKVLLGDGREFEDTEGFDRVLVDAECTHDGSIKHLIKFQEQWGWETFEKRVMDPKRLESLKELQQALAWNGFKQLKPGGEMVYSTCSFCAAQNEEIVDWLLKQEPSAYLIPIQHDAQSSIMPGTLRLGPAQSGSSGLFVAKVGKRAVLQH
jgi:16S rRNA C967 or C1407 C5-methylase (RsmB/RsmF family)